MKQESIICTPKPYFWFLGVLVAPFAGLIFTSVLVRPLLTLIGINLIGRELIFMMIAVSFITALWIYFVDYKNIRFEINEHAIILGRYPFQKIVPISEITTVAFGLPDYIPWWIRIQRFLPWGIGPYPIVMIQRKLTLLLRLSNQRLLPICLNPFSFLKMSNEFTQRLILLLNDRITSDTNYTEIELKALCSNSKLNKIIHLPPF